MFYELTLCLKYECTILNFFTTTPLIITKNGLPFRRITFLYA